MKRFIHIVIAVVIFAMGDWATAVLHIPPTVDELKAFITENTPRQTRWSNNQTVAFEGDTVHIGLGPQTYTAKIGHIASVKGEILPNSDYAYIIPIGDKVVLKCGPSQCWSVSNRAQFTGRSSVATLGFYRKDLRIMQKVVEAFELLLKQHKQPTNRQSKQKPTIWQNYR